MEIHLNTVLLLQEMPAISLCSVLHCSITRCHIMIVLIQNIKTIINFKSEIDICIEIDMGSSKILGEFKIGIFQNTLCSAAVGNLLDLTTSLPIWFKMKFRSWNVIKSLCSNKKFEKPRLVTWSWIVIFSQYSPLIGQQSFTCEISDFLSVKLPWIGKFSEWLQTQ